MNFEVKEDSEIKEVMYVFQFLCRLEIGDRLNYLVLKLRVGLNLLFRVKGQIKIMLLFSMFRKDREYKYFYFLNEFRFKIRIDIRSNKFKCSIVCVFICWVKLFGYQNYDFGIIF